MNDEKLIKIVRQYRPLYDMSLPKYMDSKYKLELWKKIGEELNVPDFQCKSRWQNIRDHYRKHLLKQKTKSGQAAGRLKKYKYEDILDFLLPHFTDRTISNIESPEVAEFEEPDISFEAAENVEYVQVTLPEETTKHIQQVKNPPKRPRKEQLASGALMSYFNEQKEFQTNNNHPVDSFLSGIAATLKNLSVYNQHLAKGKIFAAVQEIELKDMQEKNITHTNPTHSWSNPSTPMSHTTMDTVE